MAAAAVVKKLYTLKAETELRCEVGEGEVLVVRLVNGTCEVFGIELVANREYILTRLAWTNKLCWKIQF